MGKYFKISTFFSTAVCIEGNNPGITTYRSAQQEKVVNICASVKALEYGNLSGLIKYLFELMRAALMKI
jgi:hypothetical protein